MQIKYYETKGVSKLELQVFAAEIRAFFECGNDFVFPVLQILDTMARDDKFNGFDYELRDDANDLFCDNQLAIFDYNKNVLYIKESVFDEAAQDIGRARFTICHEIAHWFLFFVYGYAPTAEVEKRPPAYQDVEWQANYLAGELLAPLQMCQGLNALDLQERFLVSPECAIVRILQIKNA
ncbi:MAG: ImmA/IrrE family metallo-endopeptidase [Clostridia bacterium]